MVSPSFTNKTHEIRTPTRHLHTQHEQNSAKHRSFTIDDDVDGDNMDPNLEEPLKAAKLKRMPSRQGANDQFDFHPYKQSKSNSNSNNILF